MEELPFNRIRRRKKDNLDDDLDDFSSTEGAGVVYGMFLTRRWTKPEPFEYLLLMASNRGEVSHQGFEAYQQAVMGSGRIGRCIVAMKVLDKHRSLTSSDCGGARCVNSK